MKTAQAILFSTLIFPVFSEICDAPGECTKSIYLTNVPAIDTFDCWKKCRYHEGCNFGTYIPEKTKCSLFETCTKLDTTSCPDCRTSSKECVQCDFTGLCSNGHVLSYGSAPDKVACWSLCASTKDCNWFSYEKTGIHACILFENCPEIEEEQYPQFISGNKKCQYIYSKLLVTTGIYLNTYENGLHSEVIDIGNEDIECNELEKVPYPIQGAAGGLVSGKPMICGGYSEDLFTGASNKCFILGENKPIIMEHQRAYPASISISSNKLWITGGFPDSKLSTEIVTETGASIGQTLEHEMYWHCSAHINATHVILMGGGESGFKSYIYNLNDFYQYYYGPDLPFQRKGCAASQIIHTNETAFVIIVGPDETSEILNTDYVFGQWFKGPKLPQKCIDGSMVSSSNGQEAFLVGCKENPERIYKLRWSNDGTTLEWVLMGQTLKYPRSNAVAMLIPDVLTHCNTTIVTPTTTTATSTTSLTTSTTKTPTTTPTLLGGQYLIVGGLVHGGQHELTEVVEFDKNKPTPSFEQLPSQQEGAVGGMFGKAPILCGGFDGSSQLDSCISYQNSQWSQSHSMNENRKFSAMVQINSTTLWILGGSSFPSFLDSTEFIIQGQTNGVPGPKLPYGLEQMCSVKLSEREIFVIGGSDENSMIRNEVWIYDPQNGFARYQGNSLNTGRRGHSCSIMRDGDNNLIIVAAGYNGADLDSVEIYHPNDNIWHSGPVLPYRLQYSFMAETPDGRGVLLFGGQTNKNFYEDRILELCAGDSSWNILNITLENGRREHVVIPLQ